MTTVQVSPKHKLVGVPFSEQIKNLFPHAKVMDFGSAPHILLPHDPTTTFLLRKLGHELPAPILTHYGWAGGTPFDVQRQTCALLTMNQRAYVLNDMGTGKTKCPLWAWDYLHSHGNAKKMLVMAPLSTLQFTWAREIFNTLPHRKCVVLYGTKQKRIDRLNEPGADIFVINHDGLEVILREVTAMVKAGVIDTLVIDELATYRNGGSDRTKLVRALAAQMTWVWGMTGSPMPNRPTDVWGQASIITPTTVPYRFTRFRDDLMVKVNNFKWVPKDDAVERAYAALQPAVRFHLSDVTELPDCVERTLDVNLSDQQEKVYKALATQCYAAVQSQEITAANAGAVMMKLLQVACGWVYTKDGSTVELKNSDRIDVLLDGIRSTSNKVLVAVPFKHALAGISKELTKAHIDHAVVSGDTPAKQRAEIFNAFQNSSKYQVLAAHPQCVAHGVTLTAADTTIWYAPLPDLEIYDQFNRRIRRIGQRHKQQILKLQATPIERKLYKMLDNKQALQDKLLDLFAEDTASNPQR